jgi:predicted transcriptional regulator
MKFDLGKAGLEAFLLPWQAEVMRFVWSRGEADSRSGWEHLQGTEHGMSRASVIFFFNDMVDEGFLVFREETGKGGYHRVYVPAPGVLDEETFRQRVAERVLARLSEFQERAEA